MNSASGPGYISQQPQQFTSASISTQEIPSQGGAQFGMASPSQFYWQPCPQPGPSNVPRISDQYASYGQAASLVERTQPMQFQPTMPELPVPLTPVQTGLTSGGHLGMLGQPQVMAPMNTGPGHFPQFQAPLTPQISTQPRIIVGIDFGTTYSGIAFANTLPQGSRQAEINLIQGWPNCGNKANSQAPTDIAYDEQNPAFFSWGFDIPPTKARLKWFKLALEYEDEQVRERFTLPPGKTILDVVTDFLTAMYQHAMSQLHIALGDFVMRMTRVDFVITVPAVWSELAMQRTQQAAERAGFKNGHELSLLTEPEAAALYTLKYQQQGGLINAGDKFVVCDAGGGTVDLISYKVYQRSPSLQVEEIAVGTGDLCGSTFIDRAFEALFKVRMGHHYEALKVAQRQMVIRNFENIKCAFRDRPDQRIYHVDVPGKDDIPEAGVVDGQFEVTREEMRQLFAPVIKQIIDLIDGQVQAAHRAAVLQGGDGTGVNFVLLVGGFGESPYLFTKVCEWARPYGVAVLQPPNGSTAVVKGAVIRGLERAALIDQPPNAIPLTSTTVIRKSRKHYGTINAVKFIPGMHLEQDAFIHPKSGEKMARDQIIWFINKGQPVSEHIKLSQYYHRHFRKVERWVDTLVVCEDDIPPSRLGPNVKTLCYLSADLTRVPKRSFDKKYKIFRKYYTCNYRVDMIIESASVRFEMWYKGVNYGAVMADFDPH